MLPQQIINAPWRTHDHHWSLDLLGEKPPKTQIVKQHANGHEQPKHAKQDKSKDWADPRTEGPTQNAIGQKNAIEHRLPR